MDAYFNGEKMQAIDEMTTKERRAQIWTLTKQVYFRLTDLLCALTVLFLVFRALFTDDLNMGIYIIAGFVYAELVEMKYKSRK